MKTLRFVESMSRKLKYSQASTYTYTHIYIYIYIYIYRTTQVKCSRPKQSNLYILWVFNRTKIFVHYVSWINSNSFFKIKMIYGKKVGLGIIFAILSLKFLLSENMLLQHMVSNLVWKGLFNQLKVFTDSQPFDA